MTMKPSLTTLAALVAANVAHADGANDWGRGFGHMTWGGGYGMFGGLMMLAFWGVVIVLIVMAVRWFAGDRPGVDAASDAMDILKSRFAKGELDEDEFRKRKAALED